MTAHCFSWPVVIGCWAKRNLRIYLLMVPSGGGAVPASKEAFGIRGGSGGGTGFRLLRWLVSATSFPVARSQGGKISKTVVFSEE